jgi:error-prone DNA polymerase
MGFYAPATLIKDAQRHGLKIRPVSVVHSDWFCKVEADQVIRLGFCLSQGLQREHIEQMLAERNRAAFSSVWDFRNRTRFDRDELRTLARSGALNDLAGHRRNALWLVEGALHQDDLLSGKETTIDSPLQVMAPTEHLEADFATMRLTTGPHPMAYLRKMLGNTVWPSADLIHAPDGSRLKVAGLAICRQRPGTAKGVVFISLEDETGIANVIVYPQLFERRRLVITQESFLLVEGILQARSGTIHIRAEWIERLPTFPLETTASHDFQ